MSFYICHCGNTSDNHYFRHAYTKIAEVTKTIDDLGKEIYTLDANNFISKTKSRCSIPNCVADIKLHGTEIIKHNYNPVYYTYREICLTLPEDSICHHKDCKRLREHKTIQTHHFTTKINIKNLEESDVVSIIDPEDEEIKIIWK